MKRFAVVLAVVFALVACGGSVDNVGDGGQDASGDVQPDQNGPYPCGDTTCGSDSICIHPCCGGAPPPCFPLDDAGVCPSGTIPGCAYGTQSGACSYPPCVPPPPYCAPSGSTNECMQQSNSRDCYEACA